MTKEYSFEFEEPSTYFGLYSASQRDTVIALLSGLGVRFEFIRAQETEGRLRNWTAWDASSSGSLTGYELFVTSADLDKLGTKLVELYPERKFGA